MKRLNYLVSAVVVFAMLGSMAYAKVSPSKVKKKLAANYATITRAMQKKNLKPYAALLDPKFIAIDPTGTTVNKSQIVADFTQMAKRAKSITWTRTITSIKLSKNEAIVVVRGTFTGKFADPKGKVHTNKLTATSRDIWIDKHGKWLMLKSTILSRKIAMDGKVMPMAPATTK